MIFGLKQQSSWTCSITLYTTAGGPSHTHMQMRRLQYHAVLLVILTLLTVFTGAARTIDEGDIWLLIDGAAGIIAVRRYDSANDEFDDILPSPTTATGGFIMSVSLTELQVIPQMAHIGLILIPNELDIYEVAVDSGVQKWQKALDVQYGPLPLQGFPMVTHYKW